MKLGIDLGGSHVGIGLIDKKYKILSKQEENLTAEEKQNIDTSLIEKINRNTIKILELQHLAMDKIEHVGIACPGTIKDGKIIKAGNLGLYNFNLKEKLQELWNVRVIVENDGKCAAIAEKKIGSLKCFEDCIFLNIGTGIGGAVFLGGKLLKPKACSGFEIGHMTIEKEGIHCSCGKKGCFERYCSMRVLKERIRKEYGLDENIHSRELLEILGNKSELSNKILDEYIDNLKVGIANLVDLFEPEAICIGGSFAYYGDLFIPILKEKLLKGNATFNERKDIVITTAEMKNDAGIIGAVV